MTDTAPVVVELTDEEISNLVHNCKELVERVERLEHEFKLQGDILEGLSGRTPPPIAQDETTLRVQAAIRAFGEAWVHITLIKDEGQYVINGLRPTSDQINTWLSQHQKKAVKQAEDHPV